MKATLAFVGIVAMVVLASAQDPGAGKLTVTSRDYDKKLLVGAPVLPEDVQRGRALWLQRCAYCHDGVGQPTYKTMGPWLGAETVQARGEAALRAFIGTGTQRMPGFRYTLKPQQIDDVIAFLKTVPSSQKPTPGQLAGTQAVVNSGE
jgi:mono/diheme cytochrome c family protein